MGLDKSELKAKPTEDLIRILQNEFDAELEALVVKKNIGLVKSIARRFLNSGEPYDDLIQAGYIGLLNAIHNFDPDRGFKFSTYATHLIMGEIRHYIRDKHQLIKMPRWLQELSERVKKAEERLFQKTGRPPTLDELSDKLNVEKDGIIEVLKARESMNYISIDQERREDDPRPSIDISKIRSKRRGGGTDHLPIEDRIGIALIIEKQLSEIQQRVIEGLFYEGKTQREMGEEIGYSQRYISKIKAEILQEIKNALFSEGKNADETNSEADKTNPDRS